MQKHDEIGVVCKSAVCKGRKLFVNMFGTWCLLNPAQLLSGGGFCPDMFKALIGKGHPEFSTMRQQVRRH